MYRRSSTGSRINGWTEFVVASRKRPGRDARFIAACKVVNIKDDSRVVTFILPRSGGRPGRSNDRERISPPIWSQSKQRQTGRAETIFPSPSPLPLHFINGHSKLLSRHTELTYCRPIRACLFLSHDPSTFPLCAYRVWWTGMSPERRIVCGRRAWHTAVFACLSVPSACDKWPPLAVRVVALLLTAYSSLTVHTLSLSFSPLPSPRVRLLTATHSPLLYVKLLQYRIL